MRNKLIAWDEEKEEAREIKCKVRVEKQAVCMSQTRPIYTHICNPTYFWLFPHQQIFTNFYFAES
jgi:hypothetical protein